MMIATWTKERVEQLRGYVNAGLTCSQIADEIGVTRNAVIGKIHRLGLAPGRPAGRPARERPPRDRRPRSLPQRGLLHLIYAQAPSVGELATGELAALAFSHYVFASFICAMSGEILGRNTWRLAAHHVDPGIDREGCYRRIS